MDKKITLWLDEALIKRAKQHAKKNGKSVSRMFANFVAALDGLEARTQPNAEGELEVDALRPITRALFGILKSDKQQDCRSTYYDYLEKKYR